ncbi:MAG: LLM class flavin-dependent oxidoreductase, partial [Gemmatimonadota bacterium]|nr:LLM class flavin-dependent oxidoreductase [Gemmatimonadota bacterium]
MSLSPMQEGMLFHHLSGGPADVDLQQIVLDLPEALDEERFREAWRSLIERHAALRSFIVWGDGRPPSRRVRPSIDLPLEMRDLTSVGEADREAAFDALVSEARTRDLDPGRAPMFRLLLVRLAPDAYRLLWSFHHLMMDGRSTAIVLEELFEILETRARDAASRPAPPPYERYLTALAARDGTGDEAYWRETLAGFTSPTAVPGSLGPSARPAPPGRAPERHELRLSRADTEDLRALAAKVGVGLNAVVQAAWALLLSRFASRNDVVYGATRTTRSGDLEESERMVGVLIQTHPVRVSVDPDRPVGDWLAGLKAAHRAMGDHWLADLPDILSWSEIEPGSSLFETLYMYDHREMTSALQRLGGGWSSRSVEIIERPPYPMTLYAYGEPELLLRLAVDPGRIEEGTGPRVLRLLKHLLLELAVDAERPLSEVASLPPAQREELIELETGPTIDLGSGALVHEAILAYGEERPDAVALVEGDREVSYGDLADAVRAAAEKLTRIGVAPGTLVGLHGERSVETVVALLGTLAAGAAYVPLDPGYPEARLRLMVEDSGLSLVLAGSGMRIDWGDGVEVLEMRTLHGGAEPESGGLGPVSPGDLAYVIYTSGSTGRPKGVTVDHGNVRNFLAGMDEVIGAEAPSTWLSVTPLSFDISVLELLWTLSRGWRVVLPDRDPAVPGPAGEGSIGGDSPGFGLFYFAAASGGDAGGGYRLLLEGARRADALGFTAVWTPERHFHEFGGLYPNPAVTGSAVAAVTNGLHVRAGSVVLPLHDPIRVAEEWSVIDRLTGGRAGVAFASGWQRNDFVLAPDRYEKRHEEMLRAIDVVRRLWRGEEVFRPGVDGEPVGVRLHPRPVQDELPMWLTAAGSPETFRRAGEIGAGVLTHLLGQSVADLGEQIGLYREARLAAGHGPGPGSVVVMLHTFVGSEDDEVRELVRAPLRDYLRSSVSLIKNYSSVWASRTRSGARPEGDEFEKLDPEDLDAILEQAFERYYETSGLLGPREKCAELVHELRDVGVDEIACLIDFGVETDRALASIDGIAGVRELFARGSTAVPARSPAPASASGALAVPHLVERHRVTHLQCTPSLARLLLADREGREALARLDVLLVGGEAFPAALSAELREATEARIVNMYGPTETTVWSSTHDARGGETGIVPIGRPIANTDLHVLGPRKERLPRGAAGELYIGGAGVTPGYLGRPDLTEERFLPDAFRDEGAARLYRTGDRVRWRADGALEFLGRVDEQIKLR